MIKLIAIAAALTACGKGAAPTAGSAAGSGSATATAPLPTPPTIDAALAISPKIAAARCDEPCLFLVDTPIDQLAPAYAAACSKPAPDLFGSCDALDYARNCIYAAHGKVYKKKAWNKRFAHKPWYERHPELDETTFSTVEKANIKELYARGKLCKRGTNISTADHARVKAWFAAFPKVPPMPPLVFGSEDTPITGHAFVKELLADLKDAIPSGKLDLGRAEVHYTDIDDDSTEMDFTKPLRAALPKDRAKLRAIVVQIAEQSNSFDEGTVDEGADVELVYDASDRLVGVAWGHYLLD